jgi:hypothetical protein
LVEKIGAQRSQRASFAVTCDPHLVLGGIERFHRRDYRRDDRLNIVAKSRVNLSRQDPACSGLSEEVLQPIRNRIAIVGGIVPRNATIMPFPFVPTKAALIRSAPPLLITEGAGLKLTTSLNGFCGV